jgi:hydroxymethylglutaryl-CoA lyase
MKSVSLVEMGLRDGLQNESVSLSLGQRTKILQGLADSGFKRIEVGAFVRAEKVPQMANSKELLQKANKLRNEKKILKDVNFAVLVPNLQGWEDANPLSPDEIGIFASCTESFSYKNINCSIEESFERFKPVIALAKKRKVRVRGYLSVCFGCPFEGEVAEKKVLEVAQKLVDLKVDEISIGDTIGVANVAQVRSLFKKLKKKISVKKIAGHFHDTRGQALANILAAYDQGIRIFDTSIGGLGGCPYAPGSTGNVATEDVAYMFEGMGVSTGLNLDSLISLNHEVEEMIGKKLPSKVSKAGLLKPIGTVAKPRDNTKNFNK